MAAAVAMIVAMLSAGSASAFGAAPENTVAPTITPTSPVVTGITETAAKGSWTESPSSYAYAWYRCSGETCKSIAAATSSTYVPTGADEGKSLRVIVTATNAEGSGSAISAATAAARAPFTYFWNVCKKLESGKCVGEWTRLAESSPVSFTAASTTSAKFTTTILGSPVTINCTGQSATGSIENPSGKKAGIGSTSTFKFSGCSVASPAGCTVASNLTFAATTMAAVEFAYGPAVQFQPTSGGSFVTLTISGCAISGSYPLKGSITAIDNPSTSSLEFTSASTSEFRAGTSVLHLELTTKIQTAAEEALKLAP